MNKTASIIISLAILIFAGVIFLGGSSGKNGPVNNVEEKDGIQYINIAARGGYSPKVSTAKAGIPTKLIVETNGTFDCSAALVVRSAGFQKILPRTGKTEIDLGVHEVGDKVEGVCGMGMYSFEIKFTS